jgi:hypothetical protein
MSDLRWHNRQWRDADVAWVASARRLGRVASTGTADTTKRYERAALRWLQRSIDERLPPLTEVALAAAALAELQHGPRGVGGRR